MGLVFGQVTAVTVPDPSLMFGPDDFSTGPNGWTWLMNGTTPTPPLLPAPWPATGGTALQIAIEDGSSSINPFSYAMAIKRLTLPLAAQYVTFDTWLAISAYHNSSGAWLAPRTVDLGIDTGWGTATDGSNNRTFYKLRYLVVDEAATGPNQRWQVGTGTINSPTFTDLTGQPTYPLGYNENKRNLMHLRFQVDITNRLYAGFSVNGQGYGSLATPPNNSMSTLGTPTSGSLVSGGAASFYGGCNFTVELNPRNSITLSKSKVFISQPKAYAV